MPNFLTSENENHDHIFIGLASGNIYIYSISNNTICDLVIRYKLLFPMQREDFVNDIKANSLQMHRILIAYENTAVVVFSLNKNRDIQRIHFSQYDEDKGKALAVEWVPPEYDQFIVGYSTGLICFYKAENKNQKPSKIINLETSILNSMQLSIIERPKSHFIISVHFDKEQSESRDRDSVLLYGKQFDNKNFMSDFLPSKEDKFLLSVTNVFMLQSKNQTIEQMNFEQNSNQEIFQNIKGSEIVDHIKDKNRSSDFYNANIFFTLTEDLKFMFINLDTLSLIQNPNEFISNLNIFEKIYGQQGQITKSKLIPIYEKQKLYLKYINEFRQSYITKQLQNVFKTDKLAQSYLNQKVKKKLSKELSSDLEIQCSLNYSQGMKSFIQTPIALLLTADNKNQIRMFAIFNEYCELIFDYLIEFENANDYVTSINFYLQTKTVIITSKECQNFVITSNFKQQPLLSDFYINVTCNYIFENSDTRLYDCFVGGLETGEILIKPALPLLSNEQIEIKKPLTDQETGKVTCIQSFSNNEILVFGTKLGFISLYDHAKQDMHTFQLDKKLQKNKVLQIEELPKQIKNAKQFVYYILTENNLYCIKKQNNSIKQVYYQDHNAKNPKLTSIGFMIVKDNFSLTLAIQGRILQLCDPFSLQAYSSFVIPCYSIDNYVFHNNLMIGFGRGHFLILELDQEDKNQQQSIFGTQSGIFEEIRQSAIQPDIVYKKPAGIGKMFKKYITIKASILKNSKSTEISHKEKKENINLQYEDEFEEEKRSSVDQLSHQMRQIVSKTKQKGELIEQITNKGEKMAMESTNFVQLARTLNNKKK